MTDKLKQCPFCGSGDLGSGGDDKVVGYWCKNCQATGPNHYGKHEWNDRADADLMSIGDCPWREGTREHRDFWQDRQEAYADYNEKRGERE